MSPAGLLSRIDARDRLLYLRWSLPVDASGLHRRFWIAVTGLGSAPVTIGAAVLPLFGPQGPRGIATEAALALVVSHPFIQAAKRLVGRPRPSERTPERRVIANPDRFSFPSGHSASSLAIALSYAIAFPQLMAPLVGLGLLVGMSRVALGVHYPGDVLAGQAIAALTVLALHR